MNFSGATFLLFFLPITILIYKCLPVKVRNLFLTLASLVFCMFAGVISTIVIILSILINFLFGYFLLRCSEVCINHFRIIHECIMMDILQ